MTIDDTATHLREHWPTIRAQLLAGTYTPQPVKRVDIPKPDGGVRRLGVPCVADRLIQQALLQVLQAQWDPTFSEHSYGFRPGRSAHQAVAQAQAYVADGYDVVVDIDLEKFFDRVNQDRLMARVAERVSDKRVLTLIRAFLRAGVLEDGLVRPTEEGTPQGGPLSPLLSNLVLDELDTELERRGHRFCRYADDCNVYVRSRRAGERVMHSVCRFLTAQLRLTVNMSKSAVARPEERKFLGFRITNDGRQRQIAPQALDRFKTRVRELTRRTRGVSVPQLVERLAPYLVGWRGYFGFCDAPRVLANLDAWIRRRLRMYLWRQWRTGRHRFRELRRRGVSKFNAAVAAGSPTGLWRMSSHPVVQQALRNRYFDSVGLPRLGVSSNAKLNRTAVVRDPYARWCDRESPRGPTYVNQWRLFRYRNKRHTFVVRRLSRWYQEGADVDHKILALATYLGHGRVADTYWYCTAVPELLASTGQRFERFARRASERPS